MTRTTPTHITTEIVEKAAEIAVLVLPKDRMPRPELEQMFAVVFTALEDDLKQAFTSVAAP
jgi:hypothetical protein